jgi:hypothetical protein
LGAKTIQNQHKHIIGWVVVIVGIRHFLDPEPYEKLYLPPRVIVVILRFSPQPDFQKSWSEKSWTKQAHSATLEIFKKHEELQDARLSFVGFIPNPWGLRVIGVDWGGFWLVRDSIPLNPHGFDKNEQGLKDCHVGSPTRGKGSSKK